MDLDVVGSICAIETIAAGRAIRQLRRLRRRYSAGRWRKRKGVASVRLRDGSVHEAEKLRGRALLCHRATQAIAEDTPESGVVTGRRLSGPA